MIFDIDEIPEGGFDFGVKKGRDHFKIDQPDTVLSEDVSVVGSLKKVQKDIYFTGQVTTGLTLLCARCLETVEHAINCQVSARFIPKPSTREENADVELHESDIDTEFYTEKQVDISPPVHDQILLTVPQIPLCKEDCKGLCPTCGSNWNHGSCGCDNEEAVDPRLAVLKNLKEKLKP